MKRMTADALHAKWMKNPKYKRAYNALEEEFAIARALIEARARAGLSQIAVAKRMKTTQSVIARMESGKVLPSSRSLKRYAEATGSKLRISLEQGF
jgi:ribosome-binding protein aMBF1 (putative translation factor)